MLALLLITISVIIQPCFGDAGSAMRLTSFECRVRLKGLFHSSVCATPLCGALNVTQSETPFLKRLSPQCEAAMASYQVPAPLPRSLSSYKQQFALPAAYAAANASEPASEQTCLPLSYSMYPSSPIVVQSEGSEAFVMCTIPKAGCSLLRSLLLVATRFPRPINWVGDRAHVHMVRSSVAGAASM
jgi:hypothetical protein